MFKHHRLIEAIESDLRTHYQQYYRLAFRYVNNEADALDIVQESAYKAIENATKLDDITMVHPWIYRIVINTSISFLRKQKKVEYRETMDDVADDDKYHDVKLAHAITHLDTQQQTLLHLRFDQQMKLDEIANVMEMNLNTVKTKLYRTLEQLRGYLEDE